MSDEGKSEVWTYTYRVGTARASVIRVGTLHLQAFLYGCRARASDQPMGDVGRIRALAVVAPSHAYAAEYRYSYEEGWLSDGAVDTPRRSA